jgi:hypothetical protein
MAEAFAVTLTPIGSTPPLMRAKAQMAPKPAPDTVHINCAANPAKTSMKKDSQESNSKTIGPF